MKTLKCRKFAILMKKSLYISVIFLLTLVLTTMLGWAHNKKNNTSVNFSQNQPGLKAFRSVQQQDVLFIASIAENDFDADKTFFDLPFSLFDKYAFLWESKLNSNKVINSVSEFAHDYHLPRYLLFHNLKISISITAA
ncbi:hypothetical protein [Chryseobacterium sp.]|uniref:hypothetical protein n=1 Tax=Chryseobacterium sp. TaxID=1871047 RepID=UPI0025BB5923|nr:hypothetical protein [Chryseobacterium sp.]MBV8327778.1 hypothetical protein [Chryseobacterium sp.]